VLFAGAIDPASKLNDNDNSPSNNNNVANRLIQFNETVYKWMTPDQVYALAQKSECGAGRGFMDITDFPNLGSIPVFRPKAIPVNPSHQADVDPLLQHLSSKAIGEVITHLSSYPTRYYRDATGKLSAEWLISQYIAYSVHRTDVTVTLFPNTYTQPSYIARIEGSDPSKKDEIIVLGSHIDSISNGATAPGADDDASGTATVLEIFRVLSSFNFKPKRSIEFHGYAAEEVGLLGSQAIVSEYARQGKKVVAMLQLDMTAYTKPGVTPTIGIVTDFTDGDLNVFLRNLVSVYAPSIKWSDTTCGYGCSDHASWNRAGYVAAFPFEGLFGNLNPFIHTVNDLIGSLNLNHALNYANLGLSFLVELSLD